MRRFSFTALVAAAALLASVAASALIATPGSASAAMQVGETFTPNAADDANPCFAPNTFIQSSSPNGQYVVPGAGVITSWSFAANSSPPSLKFKVGRPAGENDFSIVGESDLKTPSPSQLNTYGISITVRSGDLLAFFISTTGDCARSASGYNYHFMPGDVLPGAPVTFFNANVPPQFDISAQLEPDADEDGFGDETQDQCPTDATTQGPCPVSPAAPTASVTGQRAGALKKCKKKAQKKDWTKKKFKKCKKKAKKLPV